VDPQQILGLLVFNKKFQPSFIASARCLIKNSNQASLHHVSFVPTLLLLPMACVGGGEGPVRSTAHVVMTGQEKAMADFGYVPRSEAPNSVVTVL
jgi:hypothetical protein